MKRYIVILSWNYRGKPEDHYERCSIEPVTPENEQYDGYGFVSGVNRDGLQIDIYDSLEAAILNSHCNPKAIEFDGLTEDELKEKDEILSKYTWSYEHDYQKKSE